MGKRKGTSPACGHAPPPPSGQTAGQRQQIAYCEACRHWLCVPCFVLHVGAQAQGKRCPPILPIAEPPSPEP